jgi:hypothetical protein
LSKNTSQEINVEIKRYVNAKKTDEDKHVPVKSVVLRWSYFCPQAQEFICIAFVKPEDSFRGTTTGQSHL